MEKSDIKVSVWCITYNHEKYIRDALESFLTQKTNFKFEIIIHDDASTDTTAAIIKEYYEKYPDIIVPIFQSENQYSLNISNMFSYLLNYSNGKYIAICEGDDYWIDDLKLQKQVEYMETNPECTLSFHNAKVVSTDKKVLEESFLPKHYLYQFFFKNKSCIYNTEDMILLDFAPTNSLIFKKEDVNGCIDFMNQKKRVCGDLIFRIYYTSRGYAYYFNEKMSAYRRGVENSASDLAARNQYSKLKTIQGHLEILDDFNEYTNFLYANAIDEAKKMKLFFFYLNLGSSIVLSPEYFYLYKKLSFKEKVKLRLKMMFPRLYLLLKGFIK